MLALHKLKQASSIWPQAVRHCAGKPGNVSTSPSEVIEAQLLQDLVHGFNKGAATAADQLAQSLGAEHRAELVRALTRIQNLPHAGVATHVAGKGDEVVPANVLSKQEYQKAVFGVNQAAPQQLKPQAPEFKALRVVFLASALPFVGFGFLDNFIMTMAGDEIDALFGARLGLSTLASAGLGNLLADVAGIGFANSIEQTVRKLKWAKDPGVSGAQAALSITKWTKALGASLGVMFGCLLGLTPLLFLEHHQKQEHAEKDAALQANK